MISIKNQQDISLLLNESLRQNSLKDIGKLGLDINEIQSDQKVSQETQIKRVAVQFEEMLINSLLKHAFPEEDENSESLLHFAPVRDFKVMLLSQHIADNGGFGYQEFIEQQLKDSYLGTGQQISDIENPVTKSLQSLPLIQSRFPGDSNNKKTDESTTTLYKDPNRIVNPIDSKTKITSDFGWRIDPIDGKSRFHNGIDFEIPQHTQVRSFMAGEVVFSGWEKGYGYMVEIKHPNGLTSRYGHNSKLLVKEGDRLEAGAVIAFSGSTGRSTGPHLHFEVRKGKLALDPSQVLNNSENILLAKK